MRRREPRAHQRQRAGTQVVVVLERDTPEAAQQRRRDVSKYVCFRPLDVHLEQINFPTNIGERQQIGEGNYLNVTYPTVRHQTVLDTPRSAIDHPSLASVTTDSQLIQQHMVPATPYVVLKHRE